MKSRRLPFTSLLLAAVGLVLLVVGLRVDPTRAWFAYLDSWMFGASIAAGALLVTMTGHATKATWMVVTRRPMESVASSLPLFALLFVPIAFGLDQEVGQDGNRRLALNHALRSGELLHQFLAAYGNLHRCPLCCRLLYFSFHNRHSSHSVSVAVASRIGKPGPNLRIPRAIFAITPLGPSLHYTRYGEKPLLFVAFDCMHLHKNWRVENRSRSLDSLC